MASPKPIAKNRLCARHNHEDCRTLNGRLSRIRCDQSTIVFSRVDGHRHQLRNHPNSRSRAGRNAIFDNVERLENDIWEDSGSSNRNSRFITMVRASDAKKINGRPINTPNNQMAIMAVMPKPRGSMHDTNNMATNILVRVLFDLVSALVSCTLSLTEALLLPACSDMAGAVSCVRKSSQLCARPSGYNVRQRSIA